MKIKFTIEIEKDLAGYTAKVECEKQANGMDAVAAIRALVDKTAMLTHNTPERILGFVEKQLVALPDDYLVKR